MALTLARHHDRLRRVLMGDGPSIYARLVRAQHHQPLAHMFARARAHVGAAAFEKLVDRFRIERPPRDPDPARWARAFADWLEADPQAEPRLIDLALYAAMRVEAEIAPDAQSPIELAQVAAFASDPRATEASSLPIALIVFRDAGARVRAEPLDVTTARALARARGELEPVGSDSERAEDLRALAAIGLTEPR